MPKKEPEVGYHQCAILYGPEFANAYAVTDAGQTKYTGLSAEGKSKYNEYLQLCKDARANKRKRELEVAHLDLYRTAHKIKCDSYELDEKRRKKNDPKAGLARDDDEEKKWDDSCLYPEEFHGGDSSDEED